MIFPFVLVYFYTRHFSVFFYFVLSKRCHFSGSGCSLLFISIFSPTHSLSSSTACIDDGYFFLAIRYVSYEKDAFFMNMKIMHATCLEMVVPLIIMLFEATQHFLSVDCLFAVFLFEECFVFYYITKSLLVFSWWYSLSYCGLVSFTLHFDAWTLREKEKKTLVLHSQHSCWYP